MNKSNWQLPVSTQPIAGIAKIAKQSKLKRKPEAE